MTTIKTASAAVVLLLAVSSSASAQITLEQAIEEADRAAYANRAARSIAGADRAKAIEPMQGILPSARIETAFIRTTDPIGAFGTTLRQRAVTPSAFDPGRLNYPPPANDLQASLVAEVPLVNLDAWAGRRAASRAADASESTALWTRLDTRTNVIRAYYGAVLAAEKVAALSAASRAVDAHHAQATSMAEQGMVTRADVLLASVRAGEVTANLASARADAANAIRQLAVLLGRSIDDLPVLPDELPRSEAVLNFVSRFRQEAGSGRVRADIRAAELQQGAAAADRIRARVAALPRINGFARYDWHHDSAPFGGNRNWSVGVMASWNILTSAGELADFRSTSSRAEAARVNAEATRAQAHLHLENARSELDVAVQRLEIAERGAAQSAEAHRLVTRRYEGGLATVAELLEAHATETGSALSLSHARYAVITSTAELLQAEGADPGALTRLDGAQR